MNAAKTSWPKATHTAAGRIGLSDEAYRAVLWDKAKVHSSKDLSLAGFRAVMDEFDRLAEEKNLVPREQHPSAFRPRNMAAQDRAPQLKKIEALLSEAGRPWAYAQAVAQRVCKAPRLEFCNSEQLGKVIAALMYDAKRHGRRTE